MVSSVRGQYVWLRVVGSQVGLAGQSQSAVSGPARGSSNHGRDHASLAGEPQRLSLVGVSRIPQCAQFWCLLVSALLV